MKHFFNQNTSNNAGSYLIVPILYGVKRTQIRRQGRSFEFDGDLKMQSKRCHRIDPFEDFRVVQSDRILFEVLLLSFCSCSHGHYSSSLSCMCSADMNASAATVN